MLRLLPLALPLGRLEGSIWEYSRIFDLFSIKKVLNGENLYLWIVSGKITMFIESHGDGFLDHWSGGLHHGNENAYFGSFTLHIAFESGNITAFYMTTLHLDDNLLGLPAVIVNEVM